MVVGIKAGDFAIFHEGHLRCLEYCRKRCDHLIVLTHTDEFIYKKKGYVIPGRIEILSALRPVNSVFIYHDELETNWLDNFLSNCANLYEPNTSFRMFHSEELKGSPPASELQDKFPNFSIQFVPRHEMFSSGREFIDITSLIK